MIFNSKLNPMIKAVIFDFGGVIIKSTGDLIFKDFAKAFKATTDEISEAIAEIRSDYQKGKLSDDEVQWFLEKRFNVKPQVTIEKLWQENYGKEGFFEGNIELIKKLKSKGIKTACLSNTIHPHANVNKEAGDYEIFDFISLSCDIGMRKPDADIFEYTLDNVGAKPEEAIYIDDLEEFIQAANSLGINGIQFRSEEQLKIELSNLKVV